MTQTGFHYCFIAMFLECSPCVVIDKINTFRLLDVNCEQTEYITIKFALLYQRTLTEAGI